MKLEIKDTGGARLITVPEARIDASVAIRFKEAMVEAAKEGPERVILDLSNVDFIDSSGLGAVVASMKLLGNGRRLELARLSPLVEKVFRLTRMDSVFTIHEDLTWLAGAAEGGGMKNAS